MSFVLGFFRLGFIDVVLSRALLRGFITAVVRTGSSSRHVSSYCYRVS